jgi:c-di-GMP-binding flagellar brake protein YcgR
MDGSANPVTELFTVGQLIAIVPDGGAQGGSQEMEEYPCRIEDIRDDSLVVSPPMRHRSLVALPASCGVSVYFSRNGARYYFRALAGTQVASPLPLLHLIDLGTVAREERRRHFRVDAVLRPVQMLVLLDEAEDAESIPTLTRNISAGGIGLVCPGPLPVGTLLHVILDLPERFSRVEANAEVVRCVEQDVGRTSRWLVGVFFRDITERERDRITAFALYQQQLLRRKRV